jgi:hypothetical protein
MLCFRHDKTDDRGNVITYPVTGWAMGPVAEVAVLLQIQYVESEQDLEAGRHKRFQFLLTPPKCLELAELLTKQAQRLLGPPSPGTPVH